MDFSIFVVPPVQVEPKEDSKDLWIHESMTPSDTKNDMEATWMNFDPRLQMKGESLLGSLFEPEAS